MIFNMTLKMLTLNYKHKLYLIRSYSTVFPKINSVENCIKNLERKFIKANLSEANSDIEFMIAKVLGQKTLHKIPLNTTMTLSEVAAVQDMAEKRLKRIPVQYVIEEWDFRDLTIDLKRPVFIPRPETEVLVELAMKDPQMEFVNSFLEIGPGSGVISVSLLKCFPKLVGTAIDKSLDACQLTEHNAKLHEVHERLSVIHDEVTQECSYFENAQQFDMLISNPPYICKDDMKKLQPEIFLYEDHGALEGGIDGLNVVKDILHCAPKLLKPNSSIWLEVDSNHPAKIKHLLKSPDYEQLDLKYINTFTDFNSLPRYSHITYRPS